MNLLPCPFCGAAPYLNSFNGSRVVACRNSQCPVTTTALAADRDDAVAKWNERAPAVADAAPASGVIAEAVKLIDVWPDGPLGLVETLDAVRAILTGRAAK
jgi:hypothetical protein